MLPKPESLERALVLADESEGASLELLRDLVRVRSPTGDEGAAQERVAAELRELGAEVTEQEPDLETLFQRYPEVAQYPTHWRHPLELPYRRTPSLDDFEASGLADAVGYRGRPNVCGVVRGSGGGRSLILNGHIDTVTHEPVQAWHQDPYGAELIGDKLFGRGTSDMKAGLAAAVLALRYLRRAGAELRGDVTVQSVVNEEHAGNGTLDLVGRGVAADAAIVLEPTDGKIFVSTPGALYWKVRARGVPRHPAARWVGSQLVGVSAIEILAPVVTAWQELEAEYRSRPTTDPLLRNDAYFCLVVGLISGGTYEGATAETAEMAGGLYFPPDAGPVASVMEAMECRIEQMNDRWQPRIDYKPLRLSFLHHDDPTSGELVRSLNVPFAGWVARTVGYEPSAAVTSSPFACDIRHLVNQAPHIPSIVFGPGSIAQAHAPDEFIDVQTYLAFIKHLIVVIERWTNGVGRP